MRTAFLVFLLGCLLVSSLAQEDDPCAASEFECVAEGEACSVPVPTGCGRNGNAPCVYCEKELTCEGSTCKSFAAYGGDCSADLPCLSYASGFKYLQHWNLACIGGKCRVNNQAVYGPGETCAQDDGNVGGDTVERCTNGACEDGKCPGVAAGENCTFSAECTSGTFCKDGKCTARLGFNEECTTGDVCRPDSECGGPAPDTTCLELFAGGVGAPCGAPINLPGGFAIASSHCSVSQDLFCDFSESKCKAYAEDLEGKACSSQDDCGGANSGYSCPSADPNGCIERVCLRAHVDEEQANAYKAYRRCLHDNNCDDDLLPYQGATVSNCAWSKCQSQWEALLDTVFEHDEYSECPSAAAAVAASIFLLLTVMVAVMMF